MYNIIFSLAVHESEECVIDLLDNINKFIPNSLIIIHKSLGFELSNIKHYNNVIINPISINTGYFDQSLTVIHALNINLLIEMNIHASFFSIIGSNELFVRKGLIDYIKNNNLYIYDSPQNDFCILMANKDLGLKKVLNGNKIVKSPPEGLYYNFNELKKNFIDANVMSYINNILPYYMHPYKSYYRKLISNLIRILKKIAPKTIPKLPFFMTRFGYASEEILFPTIMKIPVSQKDNSYCFVNWNNGLSLNIFDIENVHHGKIKGKFSVKRVDRNINNSIRVFIRNELD